MSALNRHVLMLNKGWSAIEITTVEHAFVKAFAGKALLMDHEDYMTYTGEEWLDLPANGGPVIKTTGKDVRVPKVAVCTEYDKVPSFEVKLTMSNLLVRDGFECAYTGKSLNMKTATKDHVKPRSRGGKHTWDNVVLACEEVNKKKNDRTPEEAGLRLRVRPHKPVCSALYTRAVPHIDEAWKKFINIGKHFAVKR